MIENLFAVLLLIGVIAFVMIFTLYLSLANKLSACSTSKKMMCYTDWICKFNDNAQVNMAEITLFGEGAAAHVCDPLDNKTVDRFPVYEKDLNGVPRLLYKKPSDMGFKIGQIFTPACVNSIQ
jgi:hypothetical protein